MPNTLRQRLATPVSLAAAWLGLACLPFAAVAQETSLLGTWLGRAEHNGQHGTMAIEFVEHSEHGLVALLSLPDLDAWQIGGLAVRVEGDRLEFGPTWTLTIEPDGTLRGTLPAFLVPVHQIPVVFRRVERLDRPRPQPIDAPTAEPAWIRELGSPVWAGLGVGDGSIFVGDDSGRVSALDAESGATHWQVATGGAIRARPHLEADVLFVHSDDGYLYALDPADGAERWHAHVSEVHRIPLGAEGSRYDNYASSAAVGAGVVFVGGFDGSVLALAAEDGTELWRFEAGDTVAGTPSLADGRLFFGSFSGEIFALDAASGRLLWRVDTGAPVVSSPLVFDDLVVVGSRSYDLLALDAATGERVWKYYYWFSWIESSVARWGESGYVGASDGQDLLAFDLRTGDLHWRFDTRGSAWPQPAVTDGEVFIGTVGIADYWAHHEAAFFSIDRQSGRARWQFPQARPGEAAHWGFAASPVVAGRYVYVADLDGRVYAFER